MKFRKRKITIKPDCGNVEFNQAFFNHANSAESAPSVNPTGSMGESINSINEETNMEDRITLEYPDLVFLYQGPQRDVDDWDEYEVTQDWSIDVATNDIIDYLCEDCVTDEDVTNWYEMFSTEQTAWVKKHFDELFDKYKQQILDHWEEDAVEDAETNYDPNDYVDWDSMPGGHDYYD